MKGRNKYSVENCKNERQFERAVRKQGGWRSEGAKHALLHHPDGGSVPIPRHRGDYDTGTRIDMFKKLIKLGFAGAACFVPICLIVWLINGLASMY